MYISSKEKIIFDALIYSSYIHNKKNPVEKRCLTKNSKVKVHLVWENLSSEPKAITAASGLLNGTEPW